MRRLLGAFLLAATLIAQTSDEKYALLNLTSTLFGIAKREASQAQMSHRLAGDMLALADRETPPSSATVVSFADEYTAGLYGKPLSNPYMATVRQSLRDILRSRTANFRAAGSLRRIMGSVGVDYERSERITRKFIAIGEEIKGPDDIPLAKSLFK